MITFSRRAACGLLSSLGMSPALASMADEDAVRALLRGMFDRPDSRLEIGAVVVEGDHAIAGWQQGEMAGRALLRRHAGTWRIRLCAGDALLDPQALDQAGVPSNIAVPLAARLRAAEASLPAETLARYASFIGIVPMDGHEGASHPSAQPHQ